MKNVIEFPQWLYLLFLKSLSAFLTNFASVFFLFIFRFFWLIQSLRVCKRWKRKCFFFVKNGRNEICWIGKLLLNEFNVENRLRIITSLNIFIWFLWYFHYYNSSIYIFEYISYYVFPIFNFPREIVWSYFGQFSIFYIY